MSRASVLLPPTAHERAYALITAVDSLGTGCFLAVSVVLFVQLIGVTPTQVGAALAVGGVISLFTRVPLGRLSDRIGHRRALIAVHVIRGLAFPLYLLVHGFAEFLALSIFVLVVDGWESPVRKVVLYAFAPPADRVRIAAYNRSIYNLAFAAGSLLAAAALGAGRLGLYLVVAGNAVSFLAAAGFASRLPAELHLPPPPAGRGGALTPRRFAAIGLVLGSLFLCTSLLSIGIPLLVLANFAQHRWLIGLAMALNTATAVTLQVRLARGCDTVGGATRAGAAGGLVLAGSCALFFLSDATPAGAGIALLLAGVVVLSIGELSASAATWGLGLTLRRHDLTAHNQSMWSMYTSMPLLVGPLVVAWSLRTLHGYGWLAIGALLAAAALALRPVALAAHERIEAEARSANDSVPT